MNLKIYRIFILVFTIGMFTACNDDDVDVSTITSFQEYGFEGLPDNVDVVEADTELTFDFTFGNDQITDVNVEISVDPSSTATEGVDFSVDHGVFVPALGKSGSFSVQIASDYVTEGDETIVLNVGSAEAHKLPTTKQIVITIEDVVTTDLVLTFDWEGTFEYLGDTYTLCPNVDLDVLVFDADGTDLGIYDAATAACPEQIIISDWDDGEYFFASNLWANGLAGLMLDVDFPITMTAFKQDVFEESITPDVVWNSEEESGENGNNEVKEVGSVVVSGDTYVVKGPDGTIIASGAKAPNKNFIK